MAALPLIHVQLGPRSYPIIVEKNSFPRRLIQQSILASPDSRAWIVADSKVKPLVDHLVRSLGKRGIGSFLLQGGEKTKDISTLTQLYTAAAHARLDRHSVVIAIGGGVIGDVSGFFAATYLRGIRVIHVPTTLMAQVDSAIGGKTGVNLPAGKNLVGAFHQPSLVVVDPTILNSLPEREFRSGLAEVIKYGIIADPILFKRLENRIEKILQRDPSELSWMIHRCCAIKARVVSKDEIETTGLRATLNFGHTIGHGIEAAACYTLLHGEAIAIGMIAATHLSKKRLGLSATSAERIHQLIRKCGLPTHFKKKLSTLHILAAMRLDKKSSQGQIRFVLAKKIGSVQTGISISQNLIMKTLAALDE